MKTVSVFRPWSFVFRRAAMRTLALDIGKRRIGVAVSDPLGMVARPVETVQSVSLNVDVEPGYGDSARA